VEGIILIIPQLHSRLVYGIIVTCCWWSLTFSGHLQCIKRYNPTSNTECI